MDIDDLLTQILQGSKAENQTTPVTSSNSSLLSTEHHNDTAFDSQFSSSSAMEDIQMPSGISPPKPQTAPVIKTTPSSDTRSEVPSTKILSPKALGIVKK
jgi:hypothetical protein